MPWYFRKSFGSRAFRINFSSRGVGFSTGFKGFRLSTGRRGTYVSMGRGGLFYRQKLGGSGYSRSRGSGQSSRDGSPSYLAELQDSVKTIPTASATQLHDVAYEKTLQEMNQRVGQPAYAPSFTILFGLLTLLILIRAPIATIPTLIIGFFITMLVHQADVDRKTYALIFELDADGEAAWNRLLTALTPLSQSKKIWRIVSEGTVGNSSLEGGAQRAQKRIPARIKRMAPPFLATNVQPFCLFAGRQTLVFMPDHLLVLESDQYGAVPYSDLQVNLSLGKFLEDKPVPPDATVVGQTWQVVNKDGSPNRRIPNNRSFPLCGYLKINLTSRSGLNILIVSSSQAFQGLPQLTPALSPNPPTSSQVSLSAPIQVSQPHCYQVLGLPSTCTQADAKAAFDSLMKSYQPELFAHLAPEFQNLATHRASEIRGAFQELCQLRGWH